MRKYVLDLQMCTVEVSGHCILWGGRKECIYHSKDFAYFSSSNSLIKIRKFKQKVLFELCYLLYVSQEHDVNF